MEREQLTGDEPSEAERLAAASVLLDRNAEAIFKLNGAPLPCVEGRAYGPPWRCLCAQPLSVCAIEGQLDRLSRADAPHAGLAMLRRRSGAGGSVALTPDEACLLAEAQRCLEDVARLLPPKVCLLKLS